MFHQGKEKNAIMPTKGKNNKEFKLCSPKHLGLDLINRKLLLSESLIYGDSKSVLYLMNYHGGQQFVI